jgi:hypothetical protein
MRLLIGVLERYRMAHTRKHGENHVFEVPSRRSRAGRVCECSGVRALPTGTVCLSEPHIILRTLELAHSGGDPPGLKSRLHKIYTP